MKHSINIYTGHIKPWIIFKTCSAALHKYIAIEEKEDHKGLDSLVKMLNIIYMCIILAITLMQT